MISTNISKLYKSKIIGPAQIKAAVDKGLISKEDADYLLGTNVGYTLEEAVKFKLEELSYACTAAIYEGVDVPLSDGKTHHFSLNDQDQKNLTSKIIDVMAGVTECEYHSDGEPCVYYSPDDMMTICSMARSKVTVETTYYNCIKQWVNDCKTVEEVAAIKYGSDIPEKYWTDPWRRTVERFTTPEPASEIDNNTNAEIDTSTDDPAIAESETTTKKSRKKKS